MAPIIKNRFPEFLDKVAVLVQAAAGNCGGASKKPHVDQAYFIPLAMA
jgi:hypothetical protein